MPIFNSEAPVLGEGELTARAQRPARPGPPIDVPLPPINIVLAADAGVGKLEVRKGRSTRRVKEKLFRRQHADARTQACVPGGLGFPMIRNPDTVNARERTGAVVK